MDRDKILKELMADYEAASAKFWRTEFLVLAAIGAAVVFPCTYFLFAWAVQHGGDVGAVSISWWQLAVVIWVLLMALPIQVMHPKKPTEHDADMTVLFREHAAKRRNMK